MTLKNIYSRACATIAKAFELPQGLNTELNYPIAKKPTLGTEMAIFFGFSNQPNKDKILIETTENGFFNVSTQPFGYQLAAVRMPTARMTEIARGEKTPLLEDASLDQAVAFLDDLYLKAEPALASHYTCQYNEWRQKAMPADKQAAYAMPSASIPAC